MRPVDVQVVTQLGPAPLSDLAALLDRSEAADGHPALADPQRMAAAHPDLGGTGNRAVLAYDGAVLVGAAILSPAPHDTTAVHLATDPDHRQGGRARDALITAALDASAGPIHLWIMGATDADDAALAERGFQPERDLLQMRVPLPLPAETVASVRPVTTRAFIPGQDDEAWLSINNAAFAGHPEQGGWTLAQLHERLQAPWVDLEGFRVAPTPEGNGLIGSCWTKVHRQHRPVLGEIYVVSVDPARHGEGWGRALTVDGLAWMTNQGVPVGMLYTDASNTTAVGLYRSLGFTTHHLDRSYIHGAREHTG